MRGSRRRASALTSCTAGWAKKIREFYSFCNHDVSIYPGFRGAKSGRFGFFSADLAPIATTTRSWPKRKKATLERTWPSLFWPPSVVTRLIQ